jgi:bifunctional non-homologous end joining protein LigD
MQAWPSEAPVRALVPSDRDEATLSMGPRRVRLTKLRQLVWPELGVTKAMLVQYYLEVSPLLVPHLAGRALVTRRWPNGAAGEFFRMRRVPAPRPSWISTCQAERGASEPSDLVDLPVVEDPVSLAWIVNLGCIDLTPCSARRDDVQRPDYLHFELGPGGEGRARPSGECERGALEEVRASALALREALGAAGLPAHAKTSGDAGGLHVYVPIVRGPTRAEVAVVAKRIAHELARRDPGLAVAEPGVTSRPVGRVLLDYQQSGCARALASAYSVRPTPRASVSMPVTWTEVEQGFRTEDFRIDNAAARARRCGDLWAPLAPDAPGRVDFRDIAERAR